MGDSFQPIWATMCLFSTTNWVFHPQRALITNIKTGSAQSYPPPLKRTTQVTKRTSRYPHPRSYLAILRRQAYNLHLLTINDTPTFVLPNTVFGLTRASTHSFTTYPSNAVTATSFCTGRHPHTALHLEPTTSYSSTLRTSAARAQIIRRTKPWRRPTPRKRMSSMPDAATGLFSAFR